MEFMGMNFGIIDISIIVIILLFAIFGLFKGFIKQILSMANVMVSLLVGFIFLKPTAEIVFKTSIFDKLNSKIFGMVLESYPKSAEISLAGISDKSELALALEESGLPKFISKIVSSFYNTNNFGNDVYLSESISINLSKLIIEVALFIILFLMFLIIIKLVIKVLDSIVSTGILNVVNRVLGLILSVTKGLILVCLIMLLISILAKYIDEVNAFLVKDLLLETDSVNIGRYLYENNPLITLWKILF